MIDRLEGEEGFTLVELLVAVVITAIITASLGSALLVGLRTTFDTAQRLNESGNAQLLSQYLVPDVASASASGVDISPGAVTGCAGGSPGINRLALSWTDADTETIYRAAYRLDGRLLQRHACLNGSAATVTTVARDVVSIPAAVVLGASVSMTVTVDDPDDTTGAEPFTFSVKASRRAATSSCTPLAPSVVLTGHPATLSGTNLSGTVGVAFATTGVCATPSLAYQYGGVGTTGNATVSGGAGGNWTATVPVSAPGPWTAGSKTLSITTTGGTISTTFMVLDPDACRRTTGPTATPATATSVGSNLATPVTITFQTQGACSASGTVQYQYGSTAGETSSVTASLVGTSGGTSDWAATITSAPAAWTAGAKPYTVSNSTASGSGTFDVALGSVCTITGVTPSPTAVSLALGQRNAGSLTSQVPVSIATTGTCTAADISFTYEYGSGVTATAAVSGGASPFTATLPATAAGNWTIGAKTLAATAGASTMTGSLTVTEGCAATVSALSLTPSSVGRTQSGNDLLQSVRVNFSTSAACSGTQVRVTYQYGTSASEQGDPLSAILSGTNGDGTKNWQATIPADLGGNKQWEPGQKPVRVTLGAQVTPATLVVN